MRLCLKTNKQQEKNKWIPSLWAGKVSQTLLPLPPKCFDYRCGPPSLVTYISLNCSLKFSSSHIPQDYTQGPKNSGQVSFQWAVICSLFPFETDSCYVVQAGLLPQPPLSWSHMPVPPVLVLPHLLYYRYVIPASYFIWNAHQACSNHTLLNCLCFTVCILKSTCIGILWNY